MKTLYAMFKEYPYAPVEPAYLLDSCRTDAKELNWNLVYLEKRGYLELAKAHDCQPFVACSVVLTAAGVDVIENGEEFGLRFPGIGT